MFPGDPSGPRDHPWDSCYWKGIFAGVCASLVAHGRRGRRGGLICSFSVVWLSQADLYG